MRNIIKSLTTFLIFLKKIHQCVQPKSEWNKVVRRSRSHSIPQHKPACGVRCWCVEGKAGGRFVPILFVKAVEWCGSNLNACHIFDCQLSIFCSCGVFLLRFFQTLFAFIKLLCFAHIFLCIFYSMTSQLHNNNLRYFCCRIVKYISSFSLRIKWSCSTFNLRFFLTIISCFFWIIPLNFLVAKCACCLTVTQFRDLCFFSPCSATPDNGSHPIRRTALHPGRACQQVLLIHLPLTNDLHNLHRGM